MNKKFLIIPFLCLLAAGGFFYHATASDYSASNFPGRQEAPTTS